MPSIAENINHVRCNIALIAKKIGVNPESISLVCVTKQIPVKSITQAIDCGICIIGESRVEEALKKKQEIPQCVSIHLIGHLQSRKAKEAVKIFGLIHSVDTINLAIEINKRAEVIGKVQEVLIETNISGEESKYGFKPINVIPALKQLRNLANIKVSGLMTMAPLVDDASLTRPVFRSLKQLSDNIRNEGIDNIEMKYLSMGMSQDYIIAIEEGSNMVRIGTAIFK